MALIFPGKSTCPLCGEVMSKDDEIFATSAFLDQGHQLWQFSDAGMHQACFMKWPKQSEFVAAYNQVWRNHPKQRIMHEDGSMEVIANPQFDAIADLAIQQMDEERERRLADSRRLNDAWAGKTRPCPRCSSEFSSVQDRGACPRCRHVFYASDPK